MTQLKEAPKQGQKSFVSAFGLELREKLGKLKPVPKQESYVDPNEKAFKEELAFQSVNLKSVPAKDKVQESKPAFCSVNLKAVPTKVKVKELIWAFMSNIIKILNFTSKLSLKPMSTVRWLGRTSMQNFTKKMTLCSTFTTSIITRLTIYRQN